MTEHQDPESKIRYRELRDPRALRAMAHPVRLGIMEELAASGPATATELSERIGESPANCSWHLRQLAQYGFIEEAEGGAGRQRPWRLVVETTAIGPGDEEPEVARAGDAAAEVLSARAYEALRDWRARRRSEPERWRRAGYFNQSITWLTAEELTAMEQEIFEIAMRHQDRASEPSRRPPGARAIRVVAWAFPMRPMTGTDDATESTVTDQADRSRE